MMWFVVEKNSNYYTGRVTLQYYCVELCISESTEGYITEMLPQQTQSKATDIKIMLE